MGTVLEKLENEALSLSPQQRAKLAHSLIVSLDESQDDIESAWNTELEKRIREIESGKVKGIPAEEVFAKLREKYH